MTSFQVHIGDCREVLKTFPDNSVHCCVTSPPYWRLRDYGVDGQLGSEDSPKEFVQNLVGVFREVRRVLRPEGTLWVNLGDSYAGKPSGCQGKNGERANRSFTPAIPEKRGTLLKPKDLIGMPWRLAFALQEDGWWLRADIIWHKPNVMPESVQDRPTKAHEYLFLLAKSDRYHFDAEAIKEPISPKTLTVKTTPRKGNGTESAGEKLNAWMEKNGGRYHPESRNKRSVWTVASVPFDGAHFATFPPKLVVPCILAGCPTGGTVLDPFHGTGTTGQVSLELSRSYVGIELNPAYVEMGKKRTSAVQPLLIAR